MKCCPSDFNAQADLRMTVIIENGGQYNTFNMVTGFVLESYCYDSITAKAKSTGWNM